MSQQTKKHIWRVGQRFRIKQSRLVKRVGYDLHPDDIAKTITDEDLIKAMQVVDIGPQVSAQAMQKVRYALAFASVSAEGFGSSERKVIYWDWDQFMKDHCQPFMSTKDYYAAGTEHTVWGVNRSWTGEYYSPCSWQDYEGEHNYEPGGLLHRKPVVLLNRCGVSGSRETMSINAEDVEFIPMETE